MATNRDRERFDDLGDWEGMAPLVLGDERMSAEFDYYEIRDWKGDVVAAYDESGRRVR